MASPLVETAVPSASTARAVGVLFFVNGAVFSNWLPRVPEVRDRLAIDNAGLGAALIGGGLGGLIGSFLVAKLLARLGSRRLVLVAAPLLALLLPLIAVVPSAFALAAVLTALGFLDVFNDMAMNAQGVIVQERLGRSIMQRLHGGWSLGFVVGAAIGSLAAAAHIDVGVHLSTVAVALLVTLFVVRGRLVRIDPQASQAEGASRRGVSRPMVAVGVMAVAIAWIEITPSEWSAVVARDVFHATRAAGAATVVFASAILAARLLGDRVVDRFGSARVFDGAVAVSVVGAAVVITAPTLVLALIGFAIWGFGVSVIFPQLYGMAARLPGTAAGAGLGAMAVGQRLGGLVGPLAVGTIAERSSLRWSFAVLVTAAMVLVLATRRTVAQGGRSPE